jgi:hypothetical protein
MIGGIEVAQDCMQKQVTGVGDPSDYAFIILAYA